MDIVNSSSSSTGQATEIYIKKVLAGSIPDVRSRIIASMEAMGYDVIEEEPHIVGRRGSRGWAAWFASADVLEYALTLTVRLKAVSENSTHATFDYLIQQPFLTKGDKNIVVQEAQTIAAISKKQAIEKMCSVCETESTDDSKFCRRCGAPLTSEQAELEILRIMAETHAAKSSVVASAVLMLISAILLVAAFLLNNAELLKPKVFILLLSFGGLGLLLAMISSFFAWNRINRALEKPENRSRAVPRYVPDSSLKTGEFQELPPRQARASITEGTTNLLDDEWTNHPEKEKVPVSNRRNTNNFD